MKAVGTTSIQEDLERRIHTMRLLIDETEKKEQERLDGRRNIFLGAIAIFGVLNLSSVFAVVDSGDQSGLFKSPTAIRVELVAQVAIFVAVAATFAVTWRWEKTRNPLAAGLSPGERGSAGAIGGNRDYPAHAFRELRRSAGERRLEHELVDAQRREPAADQFELLPDFFGRAGQAGLLDHLARDHPRQLVPGPARAQAVTQVCAGLLPASALDRRLVARRREVERQQRGRAPASHIRVLVHRRDVPQ